MGCNEPFKAAIPVRFLLVTMIGCSILAFSAGRVIRMVFLPDLKFTSSFVEFWLLNTANRFPDALPAPLARGNKVVPTTRYTTKNYDTRRSAHISSKWLQKEDPGQVTINDELTPPRNVKLLNMTEQMTPASIGFDDEEEHLPAGQHLLIDIENVDASFLNSESELAASMIKLVDNSGLTLLSYHCHALLPAGVSCAGVLLESHVAFHTWPKNGVIVLDLFTCGSNSLLNHVGLIEKLFAIPNRRVLSAKKPRLLWAYKRRGFKDPIATIKSENARDTFAYPMGRHGLELKKEIAHTVTDNGKYAWIYDVNHVNQKYSQVSGESNLNRLVYLNGELKSSSFGQMASYESFVHPSMVTHDAPKRILLLGVGTGAAVKEVLKHNGVEEVTAVGADNAFLTFSRDNIPEQTDCSDIIGCPENCLDDPRVQVHYEDPTSWLIKNAYSKWNESKIEFDVIMVDFSDFQERTSELVQDQESLTVHALHSLLNENGIIVFHIPSGINTKDSPLQSGSGLRIVKRPNRQEDIARELLKVGFLETRQYSEAQVDGFSLYRYYVVGFKSLDVVRQWNRNGAQVDKEILVRGVPTKSGITPLDFFDGSTMDSYNSFGHVTADQDSRERPNPVWTELERAILVVQHGILKPSLTPVALDAFPTLKHFKDRAEVNKSLSLTSLEYEQDVTFPSCETAEQVSEFATHAIAESC